MRQQDEAANNPEILFRQALERHQSGALEDAKNLYLALLERNPKHAATCHNLATIALQQKKPEEAKKYAERALTLNPNGHMVHNTMGQINKMLGRGNDALASFEKAIALKDGYAAALYNRAQLLFDMNRDDEALAAFNKYLLYKNDDVRAWLAIACLYARRFDWASVSTAYDEAMKYEPQDALGYNLRCFIRYYLQLFDEAMADCKKALELDPGFFMAWSNKAVLHHYAGEMEKAKEAYLKALDLNPLFIAGLRYLSDMHKFSKEDEIFSRIKKAAQNQEYMSQTQKAHLDYCFGKYYKDIGEHQNSFKAYMKGAAFLQEMVPYEHEKILKRFALIKSCFPENIEWPQAKEKPEYPVPIFIIGMPRSGSSLTEQILSCHPLVHGAGELRALPLIIGDLGQYSNFAIVQENKQQDLQTRAQNYLKELRKIAPDAAYVTDKLPYNFRNVGFIRLMFPQAHIIHTVRNPMDTCVSCFTTLFTEQQEWSYNLYDTGRYYRAYHDLMEHWRKILPENAFFEIVYEELIEDPAASVRALLAYCDLSWDEACLDFHKSKRAVRTASSAQVRNPLYQSSIERWRQYEEFLDPLKEGLGPLYTKKI